MGWYKRQEIEELDLDDPWCLREEAIKGYPSPSFTGTVGTPEVSCLLEMYVECLKAHYFFLSSYSSIDKILSHLLKWSEILRKKTTNHKMDFLVIDIPFKRLLVHLAFRTEFMNGDTYCGTLFLVNKFWTHLGTELQELASVPPHFSHGIIS